MKNKSKIMRNYFISTAFLTLMISCGQNSDKEKELSLKERELQLKVAELKFKEDSLKSSKNSTSSSILDTRLGQKNITTQQNSQLKPNILNEWIANSLKLSFSIDSDKIIKSNMDISDYNDVADINSPNYEKYFSKSKSVNKITTNNKSLILDLSGNGVNVRYFFCEKFFIRTYHLIMGSNGGSSVYSFESKTNVDYPFAFKAVINNIGKIERDGYGFDNDGEPTGHWWQSGTINFINGETSWGKKEY